MTAETATTNFVSAVQDAVEQLRSVINDPIDQIRLLADLASFQPNVAADMVAGPTAAVCRRAAISSLARATSAWQPTSSTEAHNVINAIAPIFAAEIQYAADSGDISSYQQLRALRSAVITDLNRRGSQLPELIQVVRNASLPTLCLAYSLYSDASRDLELLSRNPTVIHPCFMPTQFEALSF